MFTIKMNLQSTCARGFKALGRKRFMDFLFNHPFLSLPVISVSSVHVSSSGEEGRISSTSNSSLIISAILSENYVHNCKINCDICILGFKWASNCRLRISTVLHCSNTRLYRDPLYSNPGSLIEPLLIETSLKVELIEFKYSGKNHQVTKQRKNLVCNSGERFYGKEFLQKTPGIVLWTFSIIYSNSNK